MRKKINCLIILEGNILISGLSKSKNPLMITFKARPMS